MASGMDAHGTRFLRFNDITEEFEHVANVTSISGPSAEREEIEVTSHDSADGWREFIGGLKDPGEVSIDVNYVPGVHNPLFDDFNDSVRRYRIVFPDPDNTTWEFEAFLSGFEVEAPFDDKAEASLTFRLTGKPVFGPASEFEGPPPAVIG